MFDNSRIKYQNQKFRRRLKEARHYKRPIKKIPETNVGIFLARIGLSSFFSKTAAFFVFIALAYLAFAPNFLTIQDIEITGPKEEVKESIKQTINQYFTSMPFWPQGNLVLLSKKKLADFLTRQNNSVSKVVKIEKHFPSSLKLEVVERFSKFLLFSEGKVYSVSNDGIVQKQLNFEDVSPTSTPYSGLLPVELGKNKIFYEKQKIAEDWFFESLNQMLVLAAEEGTQIFISKIFLESLGQPGLQAQSSLGFTIKLDLTSDLPKVFKQLKLLLNEVGEARMTGVKYIDLRVKDRGYVCYKDAQCASENTVPAPENATSTQSSLSQ